jgi:hypothetical protein
MAACAGNPYKFDPVKLVQERPIASNVDRRRMYWEFAFVLAVPVAVLAFGSGLWWVVMGFKPR